MEEFKHLSHVKTTMIGAVDTFEYNGTEYEVPSSKNDRQMFTEDLISRLREIEGVDEVYNSGTTNTWDSVRLEIQIDSVEEYGETKLLESPSSLSPRLRNCLDDFVPVSECNFMFKPEPINADKGLYEGDLYIIEIYLY